jgi:hypothetical protein
MKISKDQKKLIQLKTKLEFYKKLAKKIKLVLNDELDLDDWDNEVYHKVIDLEYEVEELEFNLNEEE